MPEFARLVNDKGETVVSMIGPGRSHDALSIFLRLLTQQLVTKGHGGASGWGFGGAFGYGVRFENETFLMCPDYQDAECDCGHNAETGVWYDAHPHASGCYHSLLYDGRLEGVGYGAARDRVMKALCQQFEIPWNNGAGCMVHCTCDHDALWKVWIADHDHAERCPIALPNFWHKPTGVKVTWYKYIGRDIKVECVGDIALLDVMTSTLASIGATFETAAAEYEQAEREAGEAMQRSIEFINTAEGRKFMDDMVARGVVQTFTFGGEK